MNVYVIASEGGMGNVIKAQQDAHRAAVEAQYLQHQLILHRLENSNSVIGYHSTLATLSKVQCEEYRLAKEEREEDVFREICGPNNA